MLPPYSGGLAGYAVATLVLQAVWKSVDQAPIHHGLSLKKMCENN